MTVTLRGMGAGILPEVGDFVYLPLSGSVGVVRNVPVQSNQVPSAAIGSKLELRQLLDNSFVLPLDEGAYVVTREVVMSIVRYFMDVVVLQLPHLATNARLRMAVVRLLSEPEGLNTRGLFSFDDNDDEDGDPELHAQLRTSFTRAADKYCTVGSPERQAAERAVAYAAIFAEKPPHSK